jgi:hypothetical protein
VFVDVEVDRYVRLSDVGVSGAGAGKERSV